MDRLCLTIPQWWNLLLLKLFALLQGTWYNIRTVPTTQWRHSTRESIWNWFESVSATAIAISLAFLLSKRIVKELPSAHYLDCELLSQLKPFRVLYFNRQLYVFPFSFPSVLGSNIQCMVEWWGTDNSLRYEESYQLMVEKQQEICRGNYPSKKSP